MIELSFVNLPDDFTYLLRSNMQTSGRVFSGLKSYLNDRKGIKGIIECSFKDIDKDCRFDRIINSLGWLGLRDRLAAIYLAHFHEGHFPHQVTLESITDILDFETKLKEYSLEGFSRLFLLGWYLSFIYDQDTRKTLDTIVDSKVLSFLKKNCNRNQYLDIFLINLYYFREFLGDDIFKFLEQGYSYQDIFSNLSESQQHIMTKNILAYKASLNESEFIVEETI
ncbi:MAG: hypothetical protein GY909_02720 [Oligoflexia bacterium]|nr:hypothetical protein [Oligoflexia bacterium]